MPIVPSRIVLAAFVAAHLPIALVHGEDGDLKPGQIPSRYVGQWSDGSRRTASAIVGWHETQASPTLAGVPLFGPNRPIRWIVDHSLPVAPPPGSAVEFVGGDCLPGRVVAYHDGSPLAGSERQPPHLEVAPLERVDWPDGPVRSSIGVLLPWVRKIVWQRVAERYQPHTLFFSDGRQLDFRSIRFTPTGVRVLRSDGIREVAFAELAELHMPAIDPWNAYFEQVAALGLGPKARLFSLQTTWGLRLLCTTERFFARSYGDAGKPANWRHMVQPAWSLDPLWLPFETIRVRTYFSPNEVPLTRIEPTSDRQRSELGNIYWRWQTDMSAQRTALECGGVAYPGGFGVHGQTELTFPLPVHARAFRASLGLDQLAGAGGCVQAKVFLDTTDSSPLYASEYLVGSGRVLDTGRRALESRSSPPRRLILQVDPARADRPAGVDPLDIRDVFNWLEPVVELDPTKIEAELLRNGPRAVPAWQDWNVLVDDAPQVRLVSQLQDSGAPDHGFQTYVAPGPDGLRLSGTVSVRPYKDHLLLAVNRPGNSPVSRIEVRIDSEPVGKFDVPPRSGPRTPPILVPLSRWHGRQVRVELIQESREDRALVEWQAITLVNRTEAF